MTRMTIPADGRRCGVGGYSESAESVWVGGDDCSRLGEEAERTAHFIGHRAFLRMKRGPGAANLETKAALVAAAVARE